MMTIELSENFTHYSFNSTEKNIKIYVRPPSVVNEFKRYLANHGWPAHDNKELFLYKFKAEDMLVDVIESHTFLYDIRSVIVGWLHKFSYKDVECISVEVVKRLGKQ